MKPVLKINYADFCKSLDKKDNYFSRVLSRGNELEISDNPL